jgi:SAM-dependent methyltransferase
MNKIEYKQMEEREKSYWWHVGRLRIIDTQLNRYINKHETKILNVGCGTGGTIKTLEKYGVVDNVDVSSDAIKFMKTNGYTRITKVDGVKLPFKSKKYNAVVAFDVLEHIKDDIGALSEWCRVLDDGGRVLITVPAYQWLWSGHDISLHHQRRYTKKLLLEVAAKAGLKPIRVSYAIVFSLPLIAGFRLFNKLIGNKVDSETSYVDIPAWVNTLFSNLLYTEAYMHRYINFPIGTSLIAVFEKNNDK